MGIDVAKYKHDIAAITTDGTVIIRHLQIQNNREGFMRLQSTIENLRKTQNEPVEIALEDTGIYCYNLVRFLRSNGYPTFSYNPIIIKDFAKSNSLRKTKTDKKDAMTIARKLREDIDKKVFDTNPELIELKYLTRHDARQKQEIQIKKTLYTRALDLLFPELHVALGSPKAKHNKYVYATLKEYPSAHRLANANLKRLASIISKASNGQHGREKAIEIRELARQSVGENSKSLEFELLQLIDTIEFLTNQRQEIAVEIDKIMKQFNSPLLTIPGIGPMLGAVITAEIRDINNFRTPAQILAFAGAEPSVSTSGQNQTESGHMVKHGSSQLRWALREGARLASVHSPKFHEYMSKKLSEGKSYEVALSHVAKKLTRIIFHVLKTGEPFDEDKLIVN
jgi:transposase